MKFSRTNILASARKTRTGDYFIIQNDTFFSINSYTFDQFSVGNYASIEFVENGMMPETPDQNGNPRPPLKASIVKEGGIELADRAKKLAEIDTAELSVRLKKVTNELAAL